MLVKEGVEQMSTIDGNKFWRFMSLICGLLLLGHGKLQAQENPIVSVAPVLQIKIVGWKEFTGRLESPQSAEIRPRVSGYVDEVLFTEGALVKEGQLLYKLDDRAFQAEVDRLRAELTVAKSKYVLAQSEYQRAADLIQKSAISVEMLDKRKSQLTQTTGTIAAATAALELAQLNLAYCSVLSPISGRISKAITTKGNYVSAGESVLTTVVSTDKMYAYFDTDEQTFLEYVQLIRTGEMPSAREVKYPVMLGLANEQNYPHRGLLDFIDNKVDAKTGTIVGRAVFNNPDGRLVPGLFARVKVIANTSEEKILVIDKAILTDLTNKYVMVLDSDNKVQYRAVSVGEKVEELRVIESGLTANDVVVINGLQRIRPGMEVTAKKESMASTDTITRIDEQEDSLPKLNVTESKTVIVTK
jgi:membrane fusion protein, multidrug efflux system